MEEILGQEMEPPLSLRKFLNDWRAFLEPMIIPKCHEDIQRTMNLSESPTRFKVVTTQCSLEQLNQENDANIITFEPGITNPSRIPLTVNETDLKTYKELITGKNSTQHRNPFKRSRETYAMVALPVRQQSEKYESSNFYNDIIVKVRIYRPARVVHTGQSLEKPVFSEEFECLGSNYLSDLRDKISCVCKKKRFFDISNNPNAELPVKTTDPAYFFINNTFYNDRRNSDNADYSEVIRNWAKKAIGLKDLRFEVAQMETTQFLDLNVSIGFPQLYQHHGNCEHVFIISQVEVLTPGVACSQHQLYPRLCSFGHFNNRVCNMCGTRRYTFIVTKSDRQLHDPAYVCNKCFFDYHYIDGKKIGNFQAYRVNEYNEEEEVMNLNEKTGVEEEYASDENDELASVQRTNSEAEEDKETVIV
ncbi:snRNA-activating protein complex subunit 3 [Anastrepha ludens]|uniref:snRNA-activating protein complex subunit 3 n=1 Tax=Anastrepha ludens TaxID=28586 RepID=UPI0023AEE554|nr:snRNA-activating protein complex subunit 3 [Anastrepha ludens]XP_053962291.1 snRNA-activating protein complex subunit 3 [Anastrepha ludens]